MSSGRAMSKSKNTASYEGQRKVEPPAHTIRRQAQRVIDDYKGVVDESMWDSDDEDQIPTFEPLKKRKP
jgi:hypothetical protein